VHFYGQDLDQRIFYPRIYLSASLEMFALALAVTWSITMIWKPDQVLKHPAKPIIGSHNPCFGWDFAPASYFAVVLCSTNVFFTWRYAWYETVRAHLLAPDNELSWAAKFSKVAAILLAVASNFWLLLWIVGPSDNNWNMHTALFMI